MYNNNSYINDALDLSVLHNRDLRELDYLVDKYGEDNPHVRDFVYTLQLRQCFAPGQALDDWMIEF